MTRTFIPILMIVICVSFMPAAAQTDACSGTESHLGVGLWGRVASGFSHNLREAGSIGAAVVGQIPAGDIFRVVGGSTCADGYIWWQVDYAGNTGWAAERNLATGDAWLEPLEGQAAPDDAADETLAGCVQPPNDYHLVSVNGSQLNARTLAMLDHAQDLYEAEGGSLKFRRAIMQGSYNPGRVAASFGTHDAGGAIDLSVRDPLTWAVMTEEIEPMLRALRLAGFAAWLRDTGSLYPGSAIHIHAIAIGDEELSEAARGQIDGTFGYLRGYDGLPREDGIPQPDTSGKMVVCSWMERLGFRDLRGED
jgi:hypothetical protein